jgi:hypothetical protein
VNSVTPPNENRSITHQSWIDTLDKLVEDVGMDTAVGELAYFCSEVLKRCGDTPELKEFIDQRTLAAFESVEARRGTG